MSSLKSIDAAALKIFDKYDMLGISVLEFNNIKTKAYEQCLLEDRGIEDFDKYFISSLDKTIRDLVINELNGSEVDLIFSRYFDKYVNNKDDISFSDRIKNFFELIDYVPSLDSATNMISASSKLKQMIGLAMKEDTFESDKDEDEVFQILFEAYFTMLDINPIDIFDDSLIDDNKNDISVDDQFSREVELEYLEKIRQGDKKARDEFICNNLGLVHYVASKCFYSNVSFDDLVQEGVIGLIKAVDNFDFSFGHKFSTYATWYIFGAISRNCYGYNYLCHVPVYLDDMNNKYQEFINEFEREFGRAPSDEEVSNLLGFSLNKIKAIKSLKVGSISIDDTCKSKGSGNSKEKVFEEIIPNNDPSVEFTTEKNVFRGEILKLIDKLAFSPREKEFIFLRYGFDIGSKRTLDEIAEIFDITRPRADQIESKVLKKFRKSKLINGYEEYLDDPEFSYDRLEFYRYLYLDPANKGRNVKFTKEIEEFNQNRGKLLIRK